MEAHANERIVIVGAGHGGGRMAQHLRRTGFAGSITLVGDEAELPYERPALSKEILFGTKSPDDVKLQEASVWAETDIDLILSCAAAGIEADSRRVQLTDGRDLPFDRLILATGGTARPLPVLGGDNPRVVSLRTMADGLALARHLPAISRLVIIGGGVIGLEVAAAARKHGVAVTILEAGPRLMARIGPAVLSDWLLATHRAAGVDIRLGAATTAISGGTALRVHGHDGRGDFVLDADLVLSAIGIAPAIGCLAGAGLELRNGIVVNERCQVPGEPIYAIGDVANTYSPLYKTHVRLETWRNAENQSKALAELLNGRIEPYVEVPWMWSDQFDRNIQVVGLWSEDADVVLRGDVGAKGSSCLYVREGRVMGGVLWDQGRDRRFLEKLVVDGKVHDMLHLSDPTVALRTLV